MDDQQKHADGMKVRRAVLGDAHVDRAIAKTTPLTEEFQDFIVRYAWGEIWARPGLDIRSRRILVIGTMMATARWEEFEMHAAAALREGGFTLNDLKEIILQQAIYCGVPTAHHAFKLLGAFESAAR